MTGAVPAGAAAGPAGPAFLAVDGGNSKTLAVVVDAGGRVLGRGRGGRGDIYGAPTVPEAVDAVLGAVRAALAEAGVAPADLRASAFRLAGVDWPEDAALWDERLTAGLPGLGARSIKNDGFASLRLVDGTGVGLSITVGTGPALAARAPDGTEECSGMFVFHDLGGAGLGNSGLTAVHLAWMGLGPRTALTPALLELYGAADGHDLRHRFTRRFGALPETERWRAARVVLAAASDGDPVAAGIVEQQARAFVGYAQWTARRVGVDLASGELPVLLNGSVVTSEHPAMRDALLAGLAEAAPAATVAVATAPPLTGVVLDALAEGGVAAGPALLGRVAHPPEFLHT
ncbi:MAG: hypothetical protein IE923_15070 [Micrococcales bacterium]|nr:hypothetical protein [Micrococcales bacterium]